MEESKLAYEHHMTIDEFRAFKNDWDNAVSTVKKSNADLSKIVLSTDDSRKERARQKYAERRKNRLHKNV